MTDKQEPPTADQIMPPSRPGLGQRSTEPASIYEKSFMRRGPSFERPVPPYMRRESPLRKSMSPTPDRYETSFLGPEIPRNSAGASYRRIASRSNERASDFAPKGYYSPLKTPVTEYI